jgi:predicted  nucleic acid-binding Zn-ribbon protein
VHGFHVELAGLQAQLREKEAHLQSALSDAAALDSERCAAAARAEDATAASLHVQRQLRDAQSALAEAEEGRRQAAQDLAASAAQLISLQADQARAIRCEGELRVQLAAVTEALEAKAAQARDAEQQLADAHRCVVCLSGDARTLGRR